MITRTVVFPISPTEGQIEILRETLELYSQAWQQCVNVAWEMKKVSAVDVHKATYKILKEKLGLKSQYLCSARNRAIETVKAMRVLKRRGKKVSKPKMNRVPMRLDARTLSFDKPREVASVATQYSRMKIPLYWHKQAEKYREWSCKAGEIGINKFIGKKKWREHERKLLSLRSKLQSKGTRSAHRHFKKMSGRLRRFKEHCDRKVAKDLLFELKAGDTIVLERLTDIRRHCGGKRKARKKHRSNMGRWSFKRLENAINYEAELRGIYVEYVEPHYTSQMCSQCAIVCKKNRKSQSLYSCPCGLTLNSDLNAARNIANKWRVANGYASGLSVNQPIVTNYY